MTASADQTIRIATRGSALAMWQAKFVAGELRSSHPGCSVELVVVKTTGDQDQTTRLATFGGVGVFTREVQRAVLDGRADVAVHSLKDLPTETAEGLTLAAVPKRGPRRDALVLAAGGDSIGSLDDLDAGATVATGSPRRRAQLLHARPDLRIVEVRGNVGTRLEKMDDGLCDAMLLAEAGLVRLGLEDRISLLLSPESFLPAVGQGALGIECRSDDKMTCGRLSVLTDEITTGETTAERALLAELRAGCHAPLGVWARFDDQQQLFLDAVQLELDGSRRTHVSTTGELSNARESGVELAVALRDTHDGSG